LSFAIATSMIVLKCSSRRLPPTLPGLILYVVVKIADHRNVAAEITQAPNNLRDGGRGGVVVDRQANQL
jgi:hypothetical protein